MKRWKQRIYPVNEFGRRQEVDIQFWLPQAQQIYNASCCPFLSPFLELEIRRREDEYRFTSKSPPSGPVCTLYSFWDLPQWSISVAMYLKVFFIFVYTCIFPPFFVFFFFFCSLVCFCMWVSTDETRLYQAFSFWTTNSQITTWRLTSYECWTLLRLISG